MRVGLRVALIAMLLQIAVFLQPLLPEQMRISVVCVTIAEIALNHLASTQQSTDLTRSSQNTVQQLHDVSRASTTHQHHPQKSTDHQHRSAGHDCPYCTVYSNLISGLDLSAKASVVRIYIRLLNFKKQFVAVYFALQRLYLHPQGRAPPFPVLVLY